MLYNVYIIYIKISISNLLLLIDAYRGSGNTTAMCVIDFFRNFIWFSKLWRIWRRKTKKERGVVDDPSS